MVLRRTGTRGEAAGASSAEKVRGCAIHRGLPSPAWGYRRFATPDRCRFDAIDLCITTAVSPPAQDLSALRACSHESCKLLRPARSNVHGFRIHGARANRETPSSPSSHERQNDQAMPSERISLPSYCARVDDEQGHRNQCARLCRIVDRSNCL
jgi:hypothetical protein